MTHSLTKITDKGNSIEVYVDDSYLTQITLDGTKVPKYSVDGSSNVVGLVRPDGTTLPITGAIPIVVTVSRSLANTDDGYILNSTAAGAITLTIPAGLRAGFTCALIQTGGGQITFSTSGATLNNVSSQSKTSAQYAVVMLTMVSTDSFVLSGSTGA